MTCALASFGLLFMHSNMHAFICFYASDDTILASLHRHDMEWQSHKTITVLGPMMHVDVVKRKMSRELVEWMVAFDILKDEHPSV
jgi:hypothetical protein